MRDSIEQKKGEEISLYLTDLGECMKKILYVEDNEMNRDMLGRRLTRRDFEVIFAFDGEEGLSLIHI